MPKTDYETYKEKIDEIFKPENILAINVLINHLRPPYGSWVQEDEFKTVVKAAETQAIDALARSIASYCMNKDIPVTSDKHGTA